MANNNKPTNDDKNKRFVVINKSDPSESRKTKIFWLIMMPAVLILFSFWFWQLGKNNNLSADSDSVKLSEINSYFSDIKNNINSQVAGISDELNSNTTSDNNLAKFKDDIIKELQNKSQIKTWPTHQSLLLNLSISYPSDWIKAENKDDLVFKNTVDNKTTAKIIIKKFTNENILTPDQWLETQNDRKLTEKENVKNIKIDNLNAKQYDISENDMEKTLIIFANENNIYEITIDIYDNIELNNKLVFLIIDNIKIIKTN